MIEELIIANFKSFSYPPQKIRFRKGLNRISGRNTAGKTTVLEALIFGLYGEVPGVNKRDLVSLHGGKLLVKLRFRSPITNQLVLVMRQGELDKDGNYRTTKLLMEVEGEEGVMTRDEEVREKIKSLLGIGRNRFFNVVYAKQKEFSSILKPDKNKMDIILGLNVAHEIKEELKEVRKRLESEIGLDKGRYESLKALYQEKKERLNEKTRELKELNHEINVIKEEASQLEKLMEKLKERLNLLEKLMERLSQLKEKRSNYEKLRSEEENFSKEVERITEEVGEKPEELKKKLEEKREKLLNIEKELTGRIKEINNKMTGVMSNRNRYVHFLKEYLELKQKKMVRCPKCGQEINYERLEREIEEYRARKNALDLEARELEADRAEKEKLLEGIREEINDLSRKATNLALRVGQIGMLKQKIAELKEESEKIYGEICSSSKEVIQQAKFLLKKDFNSLDDVFEAVQRKHGEIKVKLNEKVLPSLFSKNSLLKEKESRRKKLEREIEAASKQLDELRRELTEIMEYKEKIKVVGKLMQRYTDYEIQLRENLLKQLGYLTYQYFLRLTDQQNYSSCMVNRENYQLMVQPRGKNSFIPAWRCGGGHESLFAIAELLALLKSLRIPYLLILDEPTDGVDEENIPTLLDYIAKTAKEIDQIILVTHHGYGEEEKTNQIRIKNVNGVSVVSGE